jgi:hypothetical protein
MTEFIKRYPPLADGVDFIVKTEGYECRIRAKSRENARSYVAEHDPAATILSVTVAPWEKIKVPEFSLREYEDFIRGEN